MASPFGTRTLEASGNEPQALMKLKSTCRKGRGGDVGLRLTRLTFLTVHRLKGQRVRAWTQQTSGRSGDTRSLKDQAVQLSSSSLGTLDIQSRAA